MGNNFVTGVVVTLVVAFLFWRSPMHMSMWLQAFAKLDMLNEKGLEAIRRVKRNA